ncbi:MAG: transcription termination/antitermination protein NusA [Eggerthellaceae bacterium]|nr:transcription termination/antitermination protein NusA [Eggerthellaceae bacterium]
MANSQIIDSLKTLAIDHGIDEFFLIEKLEESLAKTYKQLLKLEGDPRVIISRDDGSIFVYERIGKGEFNEETGEYEDYDEVDVTPDNVSYIAARNAKSVLANIVKDANRKAIYDEYVERKGDIVTGTVLQVTKDFTVIKILEGVEAELPHYDRRAPYRNKMLEYANERPTNERYRHNQRLKVLILDVIDPDDPEEKFDNTRPNLIVSRKRPEFIKRLFENEVPEIFDGLVEIKSVAREPGARTKIAVASREVNLDPVGACVGPKGSRVRGVVDELRNERVDIIQWDSEPAKYISAALSPAKISRVLIDGEEQHATVIVSDDQLSLAIGKNGQNARLAARLTGWHIDIKSQNFSGEPFEVEDEAANQTSIEDSTCGYVSEAGVCCRNHARPGSRYCGIHQDQDK